MSKRKERDWDFFLKIAVENRPLCIETEAWKNERDLSFSTLNVNLIRRSIVLTEDIIHGKSVLKRKSIYI